MNLKDRKLVNKALEEYLEQQAGKIEKITRGIAAADRGEFNGHDQVMQEMENQIEQARRSLERRESNQ
jgi:hypothetical protein